MISEMLKDLLYFAVVLFLFLIMYGVMSTSLRYSDQKSFEEILKNIFYESYFSIYAELFLNEFDEELASKQCISPKFGLLPCKVKYYISMILFAVFVLLGNVLMLNLLIAKFSFSIQKIFSESEIYYRYSMFDLIQEYSFKPLLFPPLSIITILLEFCLPDLKSNSFKSSEYPEEIKEFENKTKYHFIEKQFLIKENERGLK